MRVRSILLAVALSCGLATFAEAKTTRVVNPNAKAAAAARKRAKKQAKVRAKAVRKSTKIKHVVHKPVKR
jgi:hypothetical protein